MKRIVELVITIMVVFIMGTAATTTKVSASALTEEEKIESIYNPYRCITVLTEKQLKSVNEIKRYYGDAYYKAIGKGYVDGRKVYINNRESLNVGKGEWDSLFQVISNYQ